MERLLRLFLLCCHGLLLRFASAANFPSFSITPDNVFSRGQEYYRHLVVDEERNVLYVGAMNKLYKLWLFNLNDTTNPAFFASQSLPPSSESVARCAYRSHDPSFACQNHIRLVFRLPDQRLYICSTNAYAPAVTMLDSESLEVMESELSGAAICPVDPNDNGTAIWVEEGNPSNVPSVYAAAVTDATQTNRIIYRPPLMDAEGSVLHPFMRTLHTDSKWLDEPNFVGSLERGSYVYFFFRENAVEYGNCGRAVYSRVARICKRDVGGEYILKQNWATYVKARLNCSIPGNFPFYFDHIQDIYTVDDVVYGVFTTGDNGYTGSAICAMRLSEIDSVLDSGVFKAQERNDMAWLPVQPSSVPNPRPGQCPTPDTPISDTALHFIKTHPLLAETVTSVGGAPLYHAPERRFAKLVVDSIDEERLGIFVADVEGSILKLAYSLVGSGGAEALAEYRLPSRLPVNALRLLQAEFVYAAQDEGVAQLELGQCSEYGSCGACARDPYCAWSSARRRCARAKAAYRHAAGWVYDEAEQCPDDGPRMEQRKAYPGDSVHLECSGGETWRKDGRSISTPTPRLHRTDQGGLIILNISSSDEGRYDCGRGSSLAMSVRLSVDAANCEQPSSAAEFVSVYRDWCREFQAYKASVYQWREWYERKSPQCSSAKAVPALPSGRNRSEAKTNALGQR